MRDLVKQDRNGNILIASLRGGVFPYDGISFTYFYDEKIIADFKSAAVRNNVLLLI